jgi:hypothetical protein
MGITTINTCTEEYFSLKTFDCQVDGRSSCTIKINQVLKGNLLSLLVDFYYNSGLACANKVFK